MQVCADQVVAPAGQLQPGFSFDTKSGAAGKAMQDNACTQTLDYISIPQSCKQMIIYCKYYFTVIVYFKMISFYIIIK